MNLGQFFNKSMKTMQESFGFSFLSFLQMVQVRMNYFVCLFA